MTITLHPVTETLIRKDLDWSYADAIAIAMDMLNHHEIKLSQLDAVTDKIWHEMLTDNGEA